jgi:hypothetical protein
LISAARLRFGKLGRWLLSSCEAHRHPGPRKHAGSAATAAQEEL